MAMITDPNDFFTIGCGRCHRFATPNCSVHFWMDGLHKLRRILLDTGLQETVKWAHPCYMHAGRNIAILMALRSDFRLGFMNPSLLVDNAGVLQPAGPNSQTPSVLHLTSSEQVAALEPVIRDYLTQLMGHAEAGARPIKVTREIDMPDELIEALEADLELGEAFWALTPGRQRSYMFNLNQAKQSATRLARITKFRDKIIAGKGALER